MERTDSNRPLILPPRAPILPPRRPLPPPPRLARPQTVRPPPRPRPLPPALPSRLAAQSPVFQPAPRPRAVRGVRPAHRDRGRAARRPRQALGGGGGQGEGVGRGGDRAVSEPVALGRYGGGSGVPGGERRVQVAGAVRYRDRVHGGLRPGQAGAGGRVEACEDVDHCRGPSAGTRPARAGDREWDLRVDDVPISRRF